MWTKLNEMRGKVWWLKLESFKRVNTALQSLPFDSGPNLIIIISHASHFEIAYATYDIVF